MPRSRSCSSRVTASIASSGVRDSYGTRYCVRSQNMLASGGAEVNRVRSSRVADDVSRLVESDVVVDLARGICSIPSPLGGEGPLAVYVAGRLRELGFDVELQDVVQDRPNVVAIRRGNPDYKSFMLNGHLDIPDPF